MTIIWLLIGAALGVLVTAMSTAATRRPDDLDADTLRLNRMAADNLSLVRPPNASRWAVMNDAGKCLSVRPTVREAIDAATIVTTQAT